MITTREPKRILVLTKYRFIGDTLLAVPLLRAIKTRWPNAAVTLLTGSAACELLQGCPYLADTIEFDPYRQSDQGWRRFLQAVFRIRHAKYDIAFVCNRSFHSALLTFLGRVPQRIGWSGFQGRDWMLTKTVPYGLNDPEQNCYLDLLSPVASDYDESTRLDLWLSESEQSNVDLRQISGFHPLIGMQPGASHAEKQWPLQKFSALATELLRDHSNAGFVLIGGKNEANTAQELVKQLDHNVAERTLNLVGNLRLRETLAYLSRLQLFVAGDTAIRHSAVALDLPTVALFGPTSLAKWGNASPPVHWALQAESGAVADIDVDDVSKAAQAALAVPSVESIPVAPGVG